MSKTQSKKTATKKKPSVKKKTSTAKKAAVKKAVAPQANAVGMDVVEFTDVSQERTSIISIVKGLEEQVETAFKLKHVLEDELETTRMELSRELNNRAQLEVQITSLTAQAESAERLREDISFVEEDRNKYANLFAKIQPQLADVTAERDALIDKISSAESAIEDIESERTALGAQVMNLKDKITDTNHLRKELTETTKTNQNSQQQIHELTKRLDSAEKSKLALKEELAGSHQNAQTLRDEMEDIRNKVTSSESLIVDLRIQLKDRQTANRELVGAKTRLENEVKMANINYEAARNEVDTFKKALHDIRSEVTLTSGRVRQKYSKAK